MKRTVILLYLDIMVAAGSMVLGAVLSNTVLSALIPLAIGGLWIISLQREWQWGPSACLVLLLIFGVFGSEVEEIWLLICLIAALMAWGLSNFWFDLHSKMDSMDQIGQLELNHLGRIFLVVGLSILLLGSAKMIHLNLSFVWVLILGLLLIVGLSRVITLLR